MTKANTPEWIKAEMARVEEAQARGQVEQASRLRASSAHYDTRKKLIVIALENGSSFSVLLKFEWVSFCHIDQLLSVN